LSYYDLCDPMISLASHSRRLAGTFFETTLLEQEESCNSASHDKKHACEDGKHCSPIIRYESADTRIVMATRRRGLRTDLQGRCDRHQLADTTA